MKKQNLRKQKKEEEILKIYYESEAGIGKSLEYVVKDNNVYIAWEDEESFTGEGGNGEETPTERPVPIPDGYVASQVEGENTIEDGLVIYEKTDPVTEENHATALTTRNQYVWIPVEDINDMVMCSSNSGSSQCKLELDGETLKCTTHSATATDLVGRLYTSEPMNFEQKDQEHNVYGYNEPSVMEGDLNYGITITQLKQDFTVMAKSVAKNGGFYISRYEIGINGDRKSQKVLTAEANDGTNYLGANKWYGLYNTVRDINNNQQMVWGCQYDQVIKFIGEEAQKGHSNRNLTESIAISGQNELDEMKNIYDLEGNIGEWTLEAHSSTDRTYRGNDYSTTSRGSFYSASHRFDFYAPEIEVDYFTSLF